MKTALRDIRRRDLERAAFETVKNYGFSGTTIAKVAEMADMSPGVVHFYFKDKEELLESTIRYMYRPMHEIIVEKLQRATTPRDRVLAILDGEVAEELFDTGGARVWVSFFAQSFVVQKFARVQRIFHCRIQSNLVHALSQMMPHDKAKDLAQDLSILVDAVWLRKSVAGEDFTRDRAMNQIVTYLDCKLSS